MKMLTLLACAICFLCGMFHKEVRGAVVGGWKGAIEGAKTAGKQ